MMPADKYSYVSSRLVREVAQAGGPVKGLVPEVVEQKLREKLDPAYKLGDVRLIEVPGKKDWTNEKRKGKEKHDHCDQRSAEQLTDRINRIEPSATMAVVAEPTSCARRALTWWILARASHISPRRNILRMPPSPPFGNFTKYTAVPGTPELRDAIVQRHAVDFDSDYRREEVIASTGGKHALFNAVQVLVDHGDEVILPVPYWVSFKDIVRYAGGECVLLIRTSRRASGLRRRWLRG